jgi:hypothetical protein
MTLPATKPDSSDCSVVKSSPVPHSQKVANPNQPQAKVPFLLESPPRTTAKGWIWLYTILFWTVSIMVHALILNLSLPTTRHRTQKPVKLTKLVTTKPAPTPVLSRKKSPQPPSSTVAAPASHPPRPAAVRYSQSQQSALISKPKPTPKQSPVTPQSLPTLTPDAPTPSPPPTSSASPTPTISLKDFPIYPSADESCNGLCFRTDRSVAEVATYFKQTLEAQQWRTELTRDESAQKVYRVSKGNVTQVLSVVAGPLGTLYAVAEQAVTYQDLTQAEESFGTISDLLATVKGMQTVDASLTLQPNLFQREADIESMNLLEQTNPASVFDRHFSKPLAQEGFTIEANLPPYGSGPVYKVVRGTFTGYLNFVPDKTRQGTIIIFWKRPPA